MLFDWDIFQLIVCYHKLLLVLHYLICIRKVTVKNTVEVF